MTDTTIAYSVVPDQDRLDFIPALCSMNMSALMRFEAVMYSQMEQATEESEVPYRGGYYDFREYENGAKALILDSDAEYQVVCATNMYRGMLSAEALSLACTMAACSHLSFAFEGDAAGASFTKNYHLLREVAGSHPEGGQIFSFLD